MVDSRNLRVDDHHGVTAVVDAGAEADDGRGAEGLNVHLDRLAAAAGRGAEVDRLHVGAVAGVDPVAARGLFGPVVDTLGDLISDCTPDGCITGVST